MYTITLFEKVICSGRQCIRVKATFMSYPVGMYSFAHK